MSSEVKHDPLAAGQTIVELRREIETLRRENEELKKKLDTYPAPHNISGWHRPEEEKK